MVCQTRVFPVACVWMLVMAASLLIQASVSNGYPDRPMYKLSPGTQREFEHYQCTGEFHKTNREHYRELRELCVDCQNTFREDWVLQKCMYNCFDNSMFLYCVNSSLRGDKLKEYIERRLQIQ
uniref:ITP-like family peptide 2 n=1 Tax=Metopograpsus thukuhar TaxID=156081 RepID=A0A2I6QG62_9EUCA|nr:ITP-like family peptide 2 [Metopograpsus thukuhar]